MMCTKEEIELGEARASVLRLASEIARERGVVRDYVLQAVMRSETYKSVGQPDLTSMDMEQAETLARMLERWLEQARATPPRPNHEVSQAPPAPWIKNGAARSRKE